jgi:type IV pilus assembly protein PilO
MDQFLSSISSLANESGLEVLLFEPGAQNLKEIYAELPVRIDVKGTYHQVATFFEEVGRLDRIVNISGISMNQPAINQADKKAIVNASCTATTFRYLDQEEQEAQKKLKENSKKRRK